MIYGAIGFFLFAIVLFARGNPVLGFFSLCFALAYGLKARRGEPDPKALKTGLALAAGLLVFSIVSNSYQAVQQRREEERKQLISQQQRAAEAEARKPKPRPTPTAPPNAQPQKQVKAEPEETPIQMFESVMRFKKLMGQDGFIERVQYQHDLKRAVIVVKNVWHYQPKQVRLQAAQNLWQTWANICTGQSLASKADDCPIMLNDLNGNDVGGSSFMGGSLVSVAD